MPGLLIIHVENPNMTSKTQPVIFLDFDGVIRYKGWSREALDNLNKLLSETGARVVVSSDWRHSHSLLDLVGLLKDLGVNSWSLLNLDQTPFLAEDDENFNLYQRFAEIISYIKTHGIRNFVVLDDIELLAQTVLAPYLVLCEYDTGFTEERLALARKILSKNNEISA